MQKQLNDAENAQLSETEKLQKELTKLRAERETLDQDFRALSRQNRIGAIARKFQCVEPEYLDFLAGKSAVDLEDDAAVETMVEELKKSHPFVFASQLKSGGGAGSAEVWLIGLDDDRRAEKILGKEFATLYFNEYSELDYASVRTALTRLAQNAPPLRNKAFFDCNPSGKSHWTYRLFIEKLNPTDHTELRDKEHFAAMRINPADNAENLPEDCINFTLANLPARQRERFLEGRFLDECSDALWRYDEIDASRIMRAPEELVRIVIGVDPAVTSNRTSDETGIIAAGAGCDGNYYVLRDASGVFAPLAWGHCVVDLYHELGADRVVGEVNNGGDLIEAMLRQIDSDLNFRAVTASRGKIARADPIAALYEKQSPPRRRFPRIGRRDDGVFSGDGDLFVGSDGCAGLGVDGIGQRGTEIYPRLKK